MKEVCKEQAAFAAWVNKEARIVTFRETEGFEKHTFQTQEDKMTYICSLCESGFRILGGGLIWSFLRYCSSSCFLL